MIRVSDCKPLNDILMKKVLLVFSLLLPLVGYSQKVNGEDLSLKKDLHYIEIVAVGKLFSSKIIISVDYGQQLDGKNDTRVDGEDGKPITFNSNMDALNYFYRWGWDLMLTYTASTGGESVVRYVMQKAPVKE